MNVIDYSDPNAVASQQLEQRRKLAELLMSQGMSDGPVYSNRAGLAKMLTGVLGGIQARGVADEQRQMAERVKAEREAQMNSLFDAAAGEGANDPAQAKRLALARAMLPVAPQQAMSLLMPDKKEDEAYTLPEGARRYKGGQLVADNARPEKPEKPEKPQRITIGGRVLEFGPQGPQVVYEAPKGEKPEKPEKPPAGYKWTPEGGLAPIPGGPADPAVVHGKKEPSEGERTAGGYALRMEAAEKLFGGMKPDDMKPGVRETMLTAGNTKIGEAVANALPSIAGGRSSERQQALQAQRDWVRAKLRKESGAVIAEQEMEDEIRTYFPQIGDSDAVILQKARARKTAYDAMKMGAGKSSPAPSGDWSIKPIH